MFMLVQTLKWQVTKKNGAEVLFLELNIYQMIAPH